MSVQFRAVCQRLAETSNDKDCAIHSSVHFFKRCCTRFRRIRRIQECNDITRLSTISEIIIKRKAEIFFYRE